jgi:hypothetical protein
MLPSPRRHEIDHRTIKLIVGVVAISIAPLTSVLAKLPNIASVSESYYKGGWSQSIFIGFLFAIAALLLGYNGYSRTEMVLSKVAAFAGLGVVLFPCNCDQPADKLPPQTVALPAAHFIFAAIMFLILAYFCYGFLQRARAKPSGPAHTRAIIYAICGTLILVSIVVLAVNGLTSSLQRSFPRIVFYGEATALIAFGVSWLTASRVLPVLTTPDERFSPFRATNPA